MRTDDAALVTYVVPSLAVPEEVGEPELVDVSGRFGIASRVNIPESSTFALSTKLILAVARKVRIITSVLDVASAGVRRPVMVNTNVTFAAIITVGGADDVVGTLKCSEL
jgi:hypothetical protein